MSKARKVASNLKSVVFVDGTRTPFVPSHSHLKNYQSWELMRFAIMGLKSRNPIVAQDSSYCESTKGKTTNPPLIGRLTAGTVIQEVRTSNIAREASLAAGLPRGLPAHTVTMACISSNVAMTNTVEAIRAGSINGGIAGGVETMSDVPIRLSRKLRAFLLRQQKVKSLGGKLALARKSLSMSSLSLELPAVAEFSTGEVMGTSADRLAARWGVTREASDAFAARSHNAAADATEKGYLTDVLKTVPSSESKTGEAITSDTGVRAPADPAALAKMRPAFVKPHGTVTAASASYLTDGASAALLMEAGAAKAAGLVGKSELVDHVYTGCDPAEELLLGPAYALKLLLARNGLSFSDIGVFELHEAFAGQVLANVNAMNKWGMGEVPMDRLNLWGGSLSIGHPFGATGVRLVSTATNRLHHEDKELAVVAACAAGGLGVAQLIRRI
jgi:acetyl-CoA acetyltransferase family protein